MIVQISLQKVPSPVIYKKVIGFTMSNKKGLHIIGLSYTEVIPLEEINSLMVVENENSNN